MPLDDRTAARVADLLREANGLDIEATAAVGCGVSGASWRFLREMDRTVARAFALDPEMESPAWALYGFTDHTEDTPDA